jgi:hypothetical protein
MCIFGGGGGGDRALAAQQEKQAQEARQDADRKAAALRTGQSNIDQAFAGFDDNFFNGLSQSYMDYARPQLEDQYGQQQKNITYALARAGNLNSTVKGDQDAMLDKQYSLNLMGLNSNAGDVARSARQQIQSNKNDVTNQLNASYDSDAARTSAMAAAKTLAVPMSFSPLGNLFTNVSALAAQSKLASDSYGGDSGATLFGRKNSGLVIN